MELLTKTEQAILHLFAKVTCICKPWSSIVFLYNMYQTCVFSNKQGIYLSIHPHIQGEMTGRELFNTFQQGLLKKETNFSNRITGRGEKNQCYKQLFTWKTFGFEAKILCICPKRWLCSVTLNLSKDLFPLICMSTLFQRLGNVADVKLSIKFIRNLKS